MVSTMHSQNLVNNNIMLLQFKIVSWHNNCYNVVSYYWHSNVFMQKNDYETDHS